MSSTSFDSGDKSMAEMKSHSLDTSWDTPYSSDYIYPLFMCGDKTLSSVEVTGHALNTQDQDVTDKESSTVMFNSNVMVDNRNYSGQVNNPVLQCWGTPMTDGHSVHSSNQTGMAIAALSSSFIQKSNVQNIWGAQSTYNNTNVASTSLGTAFSTEQNATTSWVPHQLLESRDQLYHVTMLHKTCLILKWTVYPIQV